MDGRLLSVVIPALDEAAALPVLLETLRRQAPEAELVVADGGSLDGTQAAARAGADILVRCAKPGRAFQMDQGLRAASGAVVLFLVTALPRLAERGREGDLNGEEHLTADGEGPSRRGGEPQGRPHRAEK